MLAYQHAKPQSQKPKVSEIIIPTPFSSAFELVLPMVAHLSHQTGDRWMTWIGADKLDKSSIAEFDLNYSHVRMMHSSSDEETLWMMWDALQNGTSAVVIGSFNLNQSVQQTATHQLEMACKQGSSRALILKHPPH